MAHETATDREQGVAPLPNPKGTEHDGEQGETNSKNVDWGNGRISVDPNRTRPESDGVTNEKEALDRPGTGGGSGDSSGAGDPSGDGSKLAELPAEPGETDEPAAVNLPHVANNSAAEPAEELPPVAEKPLPKNVLKFTTRGKSKQAKPRAKSTTKRATRGKSEKPPKVEDVKASKGTWAFRLRWNSLPGRPVIYVSRVADSTYELIKKGNYDAFKEQLISSYGESALRASNQA